MTMKTNNRFRPGGSADVPSEFEEMIHELATAAAKNAGLPVAPSAIEEMKTALMPALEMFCDAVWANAVSNNRREPTDKDFDVVMKEYKKRVNSKNKKK
jgi:glycogen synthase